jgi:thiamine pyrophosphate-dependent acetolactate synthase large subunit-like protein
LIAVDVGNNTYSFGRYFETKGQRVMMSGYLGSIGFALPAAMGAWAATRDFEHLKGRKVVSISGDGGFGQYAMELTTAVKYGMDVTHILLHNDELGKISKEQRSGEWPVWETSLVNPSFAAFARLCGAHGSKVTAGGDVEAALAEALAIEGPALVEVMSDAELV